MEPQVFYLDKKKFTKLYGMFPFIFFIMFLGGGLQMMETILLALGMTVIAIGLANLSFNKFFRKRTALRVTDTALETDSLFGELETIPYAEMEGPTACGCKRWKCQSTTDEELSIVITSFTENYEKLLELVRTHVANAPKNIPISQDISHDATTT